MNNQPRSMPLVKTFEIMRTLISSSPRVLLTLLVGAGVVGLIGCAPVAKRPSWSAVQQTIRREFPTVEQISTQQLSDWLATSDEPPPLLLDIRQPEEYAVSHLHDAILATTLADALVVLEQGDKDRRIVVYCAVGYRSSALAEKLMQAGYTRVYNLEGSLFAWANEGRPIYQGSQSAERVHPYDSKWGKLLVRSRRFELVR
ncbi:MAG: rhodanese-like domain-containing protein [Cyanobacteria bacterium J06628_6]